MQFYRVKSSNIMRLAYDQAKQKLYVEFHAGTVYEYLNVEPELVVDLAQAPSAGNFFHREVRSKARKTTDAFEPGKPYVYRLLDEAQAKKILGAASEKTVGAPAGA